MCIEHGLRLESTRFNKPVDKLATYEPIEHRRARPISKHKHEQTDYILTKKDNLNITNCEADTRPFLRTYHFPMIAGMKTAIRHKPLPIKTRRNIYNSVKL